MEFAVATDGPPPPLLRGSPLGSDFSRTRLPRPSPCWASDGRLRRERDSGKTFVTAFWQNSKETSPEHTHDRRGSRKTWTAL